MWPRVPKPDQEGGGGGCSHGAGRGMAAGGREAGVLPWGAAVHGMCSLGVSVGCGRWDLLCRSCLLCAGPGSGYV